MWANTLWPFSSSTRNIAFGSDSTIVPSSTMASSLGFGRNAPQIIEQGVRPWPADADSRSTHRPAVNAIGPVQEHHKGASIAQPIVLGGPVPLGPGVTGARRRRHRRA